MPDAGEGSVLNLGLGGEKKGMGGGGVWWHNRCCERGEAAGVGGHVYSPNIVFLSFFQYL